MILISTSGLKLGEASVNYWLEVSIFINTLYYIDNLSHTIAHIGLNMSWHVYFWASLYMHTCKCACVSKYMHAVFSEIFERLCFEKKLFFN